MKPGSATKPFYGIKPLIVNKDGKVLKGEAEGRLCIAQSWPGQMRTVYGDHQRFIDTYFSQFDGKYFTGDGCRRDKDGYYWITGRVDDVIIVSGHNLGLVKCVQFMAIIKDLLTHIFLNLMVNILQEMDVEEIKMDITGLQVGSMM